MPSFKEGALLLLLLALSVFLRGLMGSYKSGESVAYAFLYTSIGVFLGKLIGGIFVDHFGAFPLIGTSLLLTKGFEILFYLPFASLFRSKKFISQLLLINLITNVTLNLLYLPFSEILSPIYLSIFLFFLEILVIFTEFFYFQSKFFHGKEKLLPFLLSLGANLFSFLIGNLVFLLLP